MNGKEKKTTCENEGEEIEQRNQIMEEAYVRTTEEVLGYKRKRSKPWISQKAWALIDQRKTIKQKVVKIRETEK